MRIFIGIDPGVHTGLCMIVDGKIKLLATIDFWKAVDTIKSAKNLATLEHGTIGLAQALTVVIEDPSQNKPTFARGVEGMKRQSRISQNVGSNKREATLLIEFCERNKIKVIASRPSSRSMTKLDAKTFLAITGWIGKSSGHSRDAAMLVWGMK